MHHRRSMAEDQLVNVFVNPLKLFEWEKVPIPTLPENPTPERLLEFLCSLGLSADMAAFKMRYREVSTKDQGLFLSLQESELVENLFGPLRQAKTSYLIGNYVGAIGLCGMVAEKVAILIHAINTPAEGERERFEQDDQARRVETLKRRSLVSNDSVKAFGAIRAGRKRYLHYWTSTRDDRMAKEAVHVYGAAIQLVLTTMEIGFTNGQITLAPPLVEYLKARGTIRPDEKDE